MAGEAPTNTGKPELRVGSYRLIKALGTGGMSSVFRADHIETGLEVAIKILPRNLARNKTLLQRFLREAKSAEALEHPNIVAIYDRGMDDGRYYIILEYVEGGDLHDWVRTNGPMPIPEATAAMRSVAEGLRFASERGLIHRDIKPANLLRLTDGRVKIADLGLALQAADEDERVTREGTTVGTVDYMSPEQARDSRATSIRSDIYSLGCTFFFLLTGQAPYPGGDVADKLTRHCTARPPDIAGFRPEAPLALNQLIHKMLAKRPENRFADYDILIAALDASTLAAQPVDHAPPLFAVLDDDSIDLIKASDGFLPLTLPGPRAEPPAEVKPAAGGFSLAALAALDDDDGSMRAAPKPALALPAPLPTLPPDDSDGSPSTEFDDEALAEDGTMPGQVAPVLGKRMTDSERSWLTICVAVGMALIAFVIGADLVIRSIWTAPETTFVLHGAPVSSPILPEEEVSISPPVLPANAPTKGVVGPPRRAAVSVPSPLSSPTEPIDFRAEPVAESSYPVAVEARFRPEWAAAEVPIRLPGRLGSVRRIPDPRDRDQKSTIRAALDAIGGGTIEVADDGPFFVGDLRLVGDSRSLRARPGFRPLICLETPKHEIVKQQPAFCVIEGRSLILDGLDLVVDAKVLGPRQSAVFLCKGGSLTLRNCTVTVFNRSGAPLALVRAGPSDQPSRILIERTLIRGALDAVVDLTGGPADVVLRGSAVVNGQGVVVSATGRGAGEWRVFVARCVLASRGSAFGSSDTSGAPAQPLFVRALGSTFAHVEGPIRHSLVTARGGDATANLLNWEGVGNRYKGWTGWLSAGNPPAVRVANLAAARTNWPGTDLESREEAKGFSLVAPFDAIEAAKIRSIDEERADVLSRLPIPTPFLAEKTIAAFAAVIDPGFTASAASTAPMQGTEATTFADPSGSAAERPANEAGSRSAKSSGASGGVRDLIFQTGSAPSGGDLGRFLASSVKLGDRLLRVHARGVGQHPFTPVRLPEGVALEVTVASDAGGQFPTWYAPLGTKAEALIDVRGAGVRLVGVGLARGGASTLKSLLRVERGHLVVHRCRFTSSGPTAPGGGGLIAFLAPGSLPLPHSTGNDPNGAWPFDRETDKPTCRITESVLVSSGDVLSAGVGRGLVAVGQCLVIAGSTAFTLNPANVARHRLEADLWLDHCTITAESNNVVLGPWPGAEPGPDRPWIVTTHRCAFFGGYDRPAREGVLLRVDPESFAHGALFWQAAGDAFEVPVFTAVMDAPASIEKRRPDVTHQWIDLWGADHLQGVHGPRPPYHAPSARPVVSRLKPGRVKPGDLFVDPTYPSDGSPPRDLGADLSRLGFSPSVVPARRR